MAKLVVELESDNLEHAEEECSRILRDIADKIDRAESRSNLVTGSCVDIKGNKVGTSANQYQAMSALPPIATSIAT